MQGSTIMQMTPCKITAENCYELRESILRPKQPKENWTFEQDDDSRSLHMAMKEGDDIIAIVSILPEVHEECPNHPWRLRGMAVQEEFQGQGIGEKLLKAAIAELDGGVWCSARKKVQDFYLKNGFQGVGDEFTMNNMPHVRMQTSTR